MSIITEESESVANQTDSVTQLRSSMIAVKVVFTWMGVSRTLSKEQKSVAANAFNADGESISASKKLLDSKHPAWSAITKIKGEATKYWKDGSLPFPEPGLRLMGRERVGDFNERMDQFNRELDDAVQALELHYGEMRDAARQRLGSLFDSGDYPSTLIGAFAIEHSFPPTEVPDYLRELSPAVYQRECERVQTQFSNAVEMAEQMFFEQLSELVEHLAERLSADESGKQKTFRDSTLTNLTEFFARFNELSIGSNRELEDLVARTQSVIRGVEPQRLRDSDSLRQQIVTQMAAVQSTLDGLMVDRPRRNILRKAR